MSPLPCPGAEPASSWRRELGLTLAAAGIVVLFCAALLAWDWGFFWIDDSQSGAMPAYCEMARAWRSGEVPLLNPCSWRAGAPGCEFPAGVFSPTLAGCLVLVYSLDLPLPLGAALISIFHLAVLAAGAFRVARQRGLAPELALLVALVASLNGWIMLWGARGWGVCLYSFAWLPWAWWGLEYARLPRHGWIRFVPAGIFLFLLITAGWPLTVLMAGLVTLWLAAQVALEERQVWRLWPTAAAWLVGLGLSAPAWLMLLNYVPETVRGQTDPLLRDNTWMVPWSSLPGLIFPGLVSVWNVYGSWKLHQGAELCGGLVPIVMLLVCAHGRWRSFVYRHRWECGLLGAAFLLATFPSLGNFRWSFRWLPLFFLALALVAAHAAQSWREAAGNTARLPRLGGWALLLLFAVWLRAVAVGVDTTPMTVTLGVVLLALCVVWSQCEARFAGDSAWRAGLASAMVFASSFFTYAGNEHFCEVPRWQFDERMGQAEPLDPSVRYISVYLEADIIAWQPYSLTHRATGIGTGLYIGNTPMYSGVQFITGYSPFGPRGLDEIFDYQYHGYTQPEAAARMLDAETRPDGLLAQFGVDGLVAADRFAAHRPVLIGNGWQEVAKVEGGTVYRRSGPPSARVRAIDSAEVVHQRTDAVDRLRHRSADAPAPVVLFDNTQSHRDGPHQFAPAQVMLIEDGRHRAIAEVHSSAGDGDVLIVFSRPWFPGYEAVCDGRPVPVELCNLILPAVRLPAGTNGRVTLEYRPRAFIIGSRAAGITALAVAAALLAFAVQQVIRRTGCRVVAPPRERSAPIATSPECAARV